MQKHRVYHHLGIEHFGHVNWMKGAINFADRIIVVSPKYASEVMQDEFGEGMDFTLRCVSYKIRGILNGIDYKIFNPKTDKALIQNYDINSI